jgi:hypothetical protein
VFEPVTLVPFELKLIDFGLMSPAQIEWFNDYNKQIKDRIVPILMVKLIYYLLNGNMTFR